MEVIILSVIGIYLVFGSFVLNTEDLKSAFYFKFLPFVFGITLLIMAAIEYGFVFQPLAG